MLLASSRGAPYTLGDVELTMESSANVDHAVVYPPAQAVCIEPQTCAIDAFSIAAGRYDVRGMAVLVPGGILRATSEWRWTIGGRELARAAIRLLFEADDLAEASRRHAPSGRARCGCRPSGVWCAGKPVRRVGGAKRPRISLASRFTFRRIV